MTNVWDIERDWLSPLERDLLKQIVPRVIHEAVHIISNPRADNRDKIKAMRLILNYAYGTPATHAVVRYELDRLRDLPYGAGSHYPQVGELGSQPADNEPIQDGDAVDPKPEVHIYDPRPSRARETALDVSSENADQNDAAGQEPVKEPAVTDTQPTAPQQTEPKRSPTKAEMYDRWRALSE